MALTRKYRKARSKKKTSTAGAKRRGPRLEKFGIGEPGHFVATFEHALDGVKHIAGDDFVSAQELHGTIEPAFKELSKSVQEPNWYIEINKALTSAIEVLEKKNTRPQNKLFPGTLEEALVTLDMGLTQDFAKNLWDNHWDILLEVKRMLSKDKSEEGQNYALQFMADRLALVKKWVENGTGVWPNCKVNTRYRLWATFFGMCIHDAPCIVIARPGICEKILLFWEDEKTRLVRAVGRLSFHRKIRAIKLQHGLWFNHMRVELDKEARFHDLRSLPPVITKLLLNIKYRRRMLPDSIFQEIPDLVRTRAVEPDFVEEHVQQLGKPGKESTVSRRAVAIKRSLSYFDGRVLPSSM
ncbi:MAG: hypothetical protein JRL30_29810, partial [Deltaproteobacteria bacterium]|nr:hypothetical protein [Deltaproteobacteria bacterium]